MKKIKINEIGQFLKSKGFKKKSIKTYCSIIEKILKKLGEEFTGEQLENLFTTLNLKPRTYNLYRTIMNFYTKKYLNYELSFTKAKVDQSLPTYVSEEEFEKFLSVIPNIKHKIAFNLMYKSGIRVEEVCKIKKHDIYSDELIVRIEEGKGGKGRPTILSVKLIPDLNDFIKTTNPKNPYLFQTYRGRISERSFQERLKKAIKDSGLTKHFGCHSLRHSFAINMLNKGTDLEIVRRLLGHSSLRTTQIYLQCRTIDLTSLARNVA